MSSFAPASLWVAITCLERSTIHSYYAISSFLSPKGVVVLDCYATFLLSEGNRLSGKIKVEISSEGVDDPDYTRIASIKINGIERSPMARGMNIVILDAAGNYLMSRNFDTADPSRGRAEGEKMAQFLDDLPSERMVCVSSLESTGLYQFQLHIRCHQAMVFYSNP